MASPYADKVLADGAVAYWRLDEASGTTANSLVGTYPGTISGGVTLNQGGALSDGNMAMLFDGTTGRVLTASTLLVPATSTVECFIKTTDVGIAQPIVSFRGGPGANPGQWVLWTQSGGLSVYCDDGGHANSASSVADGMFHHCVWVSNGSTTWLYVDGVVKLGPVAQTHAARTDKVAIGWDLFQGYGPLAVIDEVAIYPTALTPQQIAAHYALRTATGMPAWHDLRYRHCRFVRAPGWRRSA